MQSSATETGMAYAIDDNKDKDDTLAATLESDINVRVEALPDEILEFILTYLPPYKDLESCRLVSKRWQEIVENLIRRSKLNLHKGLLDYRLRWQLYTPTVANIANNCSPSNALLPIIAGRFSHSAVRHGNSMYIFGGGSSSDTTFNDLWRFDLSDMRWERPLSMGSYPSPKGSASMVCWREQLVLFGGWRYPSLHPPYQPWCLFDELHFYDLATQRWIVRIALPSPPPLAGHSASVHGDLMVVFGGYQIIEGVNSNSNQTWCFDLRDHKWWQPRIVGNTKPPPRYGQFQLVLDEQHLLVVGGCGGPNSVYSDAWLLDMTVRDAWTWRALPVRNKKYGASHMWCNPACKLDSKLVVLGPTPNMPQDFQLMRQMRMPVGGGGMPAPRLVGGVGQQQQRHNMLLERQRAGGLIAGNAIGGFGALRAPQLNQQRVDNYRLGGGAGVGGLRQGPDDQYYANRRAILNQNQQQQHNNFLNNNNINHNGNNNGIGGSNNNNTLQPRTGRLSELHGAPAVSANVAAERNQHRPTSAQLNGGSAAASSSTAVARNDNESTANSSGGGGRNNKDLEAANRLQRNLALRCRENEPLLPKRFDELYEDPFRMAAFNVRSRPRSVSKDHNERIRRMEEKMNAIRNSRRNAAANVEPKCSKEPSPKRIKRNVLSLFVCDLAAALDPKDPHLQWLEYKNYGIVPGAPERLILSTMVAGHGELILFGGVHKETLSEITHQVSNAVHFLNAPRDIV